jgi:hypothetical protein
LSGKLPAACLDQRFRSLIGEVPDALLHELVDLLKLGPTSANCSPARGTNIKSNFLCNLGYGDGEKLFPRSPRFDFDEMAKII